MLPGLNYTKRCRKFSLLNKVYINIEDKNNKHIFSENGIKNIKMMIICIKIVFMSKFYNYPISRIIQEIKIDKRLKRFLKISDEIPSEGQVYEYLSRYSPDQYNNISNSFFKLFLKSNRNHKWFNRWCNTCGLWYQYRKEICYSWKTLRIQIRYGLFIQYWLLYWI